MVKRGKRGSIKSREYSKETVPATVAPTSSNNKFNAEKIQRMTGAQISDHMDTLSREEKCMLCLNLVINS